MKITSQKFHAPHLPINEEALIRCQSALELKDRGDFEAARKAMGFLWTRVGENPDIKGLHPSVVAEVLLCVGVLTGWIGSREGIESAQEIAKNLINQSINFYES